MNFSKLLLLPLLFIGFTVLSQQKSPKDLMVHYIDSAYNERPKEILDEAKQLVKQSFIQTKVQSLIDNYIIYINSFILN